MLNVCVNVEVSDFPCGPCFFLGRDSRRELKERERGKNDYEYSVHIYHEIGPIGHIGPIQPICRSRVYGCHAEQTAVVACVQEAVHLAHLTAPAPDIRELP